MYPLVRGASWYGVAASLKTSSSEDISESLLFTDSGMLFIMLGGWFDLLCTYRGVGVRSWIIWAKTFNCYSEFPKQSSGNCQK